MRGRGRTSDDCAADAARPVEAASAAPVPAAGERVRRAATARCGHRPCPYHRRRHRCARRVQRRARNRVRDGAAVRNDWVGSGTTKDIPHEPAGGSYSRRNARSARRSATACDLAPYTSPERRLDAIYDRVLRNTLRDDFTSDEVEDACSSLRTVLGSIAVQRSALSAPALAAMLHLSEVDVRDILRDVHSIFDVPDDPYRPIRPRHASVRDYLLNQRRCTDARFWIDEQRAHAQLASQCHRAMNEALHNDMCHLRMPDARTSNVSEDTMATCLPPHLRYACQYWVLHLQKSPDSPEQKKSVDEFMRRNFLNWLETFSLLNKLDDAAAMLGHLELMFVSSSNISQAFLGASLRHGRPSGTTNPCCRR